MMEKEEKIKFKTEKSNEIEFANIFDLRNIQRMQDLFSDATGVASIITFPDGAPITAPSNFCRLCNDIIRKTKKGSANCFLTDDMRSNGSSSGYLVLPCQSCGLQGAFTKITVGGQHIANWVIGQVRNKELDEQQMMQYANEIGTNRNDFIEAMKEVPVMSVEQFTKVLKMLDSYTAEWSENAFNNLQLKMQIADLKQSGEEVEESRVKYRGFCEAAFEAIFFSEKGLCIEQNQTAENMFGYTSEEAIGKYGTDWIVPEDRDMVMKNMLSGFEEPYKAIALKKDGTTFPCFLRGKMMHYKGRIVRVTSLTDITDLKHVEDALQESEEKYRLIAENTSDGIILFGADNITQYASPAYLKQLGIDDIVQLNRTPEGIYSMIHPDDRDAVFAEIFKAIELKKSGLTYSYRVKHTAGHFIWREDNAKFKYNSSGNYTGAYVICRDITERKRAEESLRIKDWAIESAINPIAISDLTGNLNYANPAFLKLWRYANLEEMLGKSPASFWQMDEDYSEIMEILLERGGWSGEMVAQSRDGSLFDVHIEASLVTNAEGQPFCLLASFADITERKQAEKELIKLTRAVEQSPVSIVITNLDGNIIYGNPKVSEITGYSIDELLGKNSRLFQSGETPAETYKNLWDTIISGKEWRGELHNKKKNGELYWESASISPILDTEGRITDFLAVKEDITPLKQLITNLEGAKEKAEAGNRLKTAFMHNISHEIRTPLNGIIGFSSLIIQPDFTGEEKQQFYTFINASSNRLINTITSYMDISLIASGNMEIHRKPFNLQKILHQIYEQVEPLCTVKNLILRLIIPEKADDIILYSDNELIPKALSHLLDNAVKFTNTGEITFGYIIKTGLLEFFVTDTGNGISKDAQARIFENFVQEEVLNTRGYEGSGLGLSIAQGIARLLGGEIQVESEKGIGSTFYFYIPYDAIDNEMKVSSIKLEGS
ncbi:MAG: PAS domain S-box protein [Bacteroidota bacterium]